jgi:hypothetical protein
VGQGRLQGAAPPGLRRLNLEPSRISQNEERLSP